MRRLILAMALLVTACGGTAATTGPSAAPQATASPTTRPTVPTPKPTPSPAPTPTTDPEIVATAFRLTFWDTYSDIYKTTLADYMEEGYVFVDSVDGVEFDDDTYTIRYSITSDYESLYSRRHQEWLDDTWQFYRDYAREIWSTVKENLGSDVEGVPLDWAELTPTLTVSGPRGRLSVSCPGSFIDRAGEREADQEDFEDDCSFKYGAG